MGTPQFYLASTSPRRKVLLQQLQLDFKTLVIEVDESKKPKESPASYVKRLAQAKAEQGWQQLQSLDWSLRPVLAADTAVIYKQQVLGKPKHKRDAIEMLSLLSGKGHQVLTAVTLCYKKKKKTCLVTTEVVFRPLTQAEIQAYWQTGEPKDKAGAYAIQGLGAFFVKSIHGSYSAVVGLPLLETAASLRTFGVKVLR